MTLMGECCQQDQQLNINASIMQHLVNLIQIVSTRTSNACLIGRYY